MAKVSTLVIWMNKDKHAVMELFTYLKSQLQEPGSIINHMEFVCLLTSADNILFRSTCDKQSKLNSSNRREERGIRLWQMDINHIQERSNSNAKSDREKEKENPRQ